MRFCVWIPASAGMTNMILPEIKNSNLKTKKMPPILSVKNLTKEFKNFKAVDEVSFDVEEGEIFGLQISLKN